MPRQDFSSPRVCVEARLAADETVPLTREQSHHLGVVLRLGGGASVLAFNGRDGEWRGSLQGTRGSAAIRIEVPTRPQPARNDLLYAFAPLKHARLDYLVQKAVELGAGVLQPVITRRTQAARVNEGRMRANAVEAAEQCGVLAVPEVRAPVSFDGLVAAWDGERVMVFCDEDAEVADPVAALKAAGVGRKLGVIVGPEGGFHPAERDALLALPRRVRLSLGPRILRADTAAVAALAIVQAVLGDGVGAADAGPQGWRDQNIGLPPAPVIGAPDM